MTDVNPCEGCPYFKEGMFCMHNILGCWKQDDEGDFDLDDAFMEDLDNW